MTAELHRRGYHVNHKRIQRLMADMGIKALYPKKRTSIINSAHKKLKDMEIDRPNHVWLTDITYIRYGSGFIYLVALIDVFSRYILSWQLSNTMDVQFCMDMLEAALEKHGTPEIINTDHGSQFTCPTWVDRVEESGAKVSMDGKGRLPDNIYIERFWRTIKHEHIAYQVFDNVRHVRESIGDIIHVYNTKRLHQSLGYQTPNEVYHQDIKDYHLKLVYGNVENTSYLHTVPQTQQQII
ncbi:MAG: IS3 family transposase [Alphaproteobacteria bacterium]|nr:IS3 family transposase [Alphaproteobacteria bacterium]